MDDDVKYWKAVAAWMGDVLAATAGHQIMLKSVSKNEKQRQARICGTAAASLMGNNFPSARPVDAVIKRLTDLAMTVEH
jgi:hypothetical protein